MTGRLGGRVALLDPVSRVVGVRSDRFGTHLTSASEGSARPHTEPAWPMSTPRKHHYCPQFYLRGFSANGAAVLQIEKKTGRAFPVAIPNAAAIRDYHAIDSGAGDPNEVEKRMSQVEGLHARTLAQVVASGIATSEHREAVVNLVALLRVRVPAFKAGVEGHQESWVRAVGLMMERRGLLPPPPVGFEEVLRMDKLGIEIANWKILELMFGAAAEGSIPSLLHMKAAILRAQEGTHFLTCDQPVAVFNPSATATDTYGTGLEHPETQVSLPLSSGAMLLLGRKISGPADREATPAEVAEFNRRTVVMADSLLFAPETSQGSIGLVSRYAHCSAGMVEDVLVTDAEAALIVRFRPVLRAECYCQDEPGQTKSL